MSAIEVQTNPDLANYLRSLGVNVTSPVDLAVRALSKQVQARNEADAAVLAGLISSAESKMTSSAVTLFGLKKQQAEIETDNLKTARCLAYALGTGNAIPLKSNLGLPVPQHLIASGATKVPDDWTPPAAPAADAAPAANTAAS